MAWPLGKKRAGHVNKDGSLHRPRGTKRSRTLRTTPTLAKGRAVDAQAKAATPVESGEIKKEWRSLLRHVGWSLVADHCPACGFPEADAGFCNACGWSKPVKMGRVA